VSAAPRVLVIGYGNPLRRDDGVGPRAAAAVASWQLPGVVAREVYQLVPELADDLSRVEWALFVDASLDTSEVHACEAAPSPAPACLDHTSDPARLLALTAAVYGRRPRAWLLTVPAADFGFGEALSPASEDGLRSALAWARAWLEERGVPVGDGDGRPSRELKWLMNR
jgi:hydrogenase maturation protease